ncbi:Canalicular multispecific organic anion transporter 1 [Coemansia spiralis]|uniref:Canalicular multispecific organic anion transporter 1 n=2 Tax=Coemansia TaxID=4863 RepID=A0A9W8KWJ6_9FUNG|nr:Canalicular multispecific organic anion transporter 1 [Coemansia umbellata]KAJ2621233.1 Canalicular multispecific organic anion transporter 1 [Coemansia sp. RSA 1358]KAJ2676780.1 Canalicular multispecific organic anion transporter 1 [Coemansia spiralis]
MPLTKGSGCVYGSIGYVSQKPWIMNGTFRDNVLFGNSYNEEFYNQVIEACALVDIKKLPAGDITEIGYKGINLSGGQKMRLALARAIYSNADIYILDDVFAAVDAHVERHLIEHLLSGNGLLSKKTCILATHAEHIVPLSNKVITMTNGSVIITNQVSAKFANKLSGLNLASRIDNNNRDNPQSDSDFCKSNAGTFTIQPELNIPHFKMSTMWKFLRLSGYTTVVVALFIQYSQAYTIYYIDKKWQLIASESCTLMATSALRTYLVLQVVLEILRNQFEKIGQQILEYIWGNRISKIMRKKLAASYLNTPLSVFERLPRHNLKRVYIGSIFNSAYLLPENICRCALDIFVTGYALIAVYQSLPMLLLPILPFVVGAFRVTSHCRSASKILATELNAENDTAFASLSNELIIGSEIVRIHRKANLFTSHLFELSLNSVYLNTLADKFCLYTSRINQTLSEILSLGVVLYSKWLQVNGSSTIGPVVVDMWKTLCFQAYLDTHNLYSKNNEIKIYLPSLTKYFVYAEQLKQEAPRVIEDNRPPENWPSCGLVEFKSYSMRYQDDLDDVLKGLTFSVRSNEKIGIVGRTGAGKSSIAHALLRLVEPASGKIVIDNIDVSTIGLADLRSCITIVPQDPTLFEGTVRDNLDPSHQYADDKIWEALRKVQMVDALGNSDDRKNSWDKTNKEDATSYYWKYKTGLQKWVEANGSNFSVGQRQLLSLCRALVWRRKIVILDEATANIDSRTDQIMQSVVRNEFKNCTVLTIAHRLKTIMGSNRILVMDQGQVVEFDTPSNLLSHNSFFSRLVKSMEFNEQTIQTASIF